MQEITSHLYLSSLGHFVRWGCRGLSWIKRVGGGIHFLHSIQIFFSYLFYLHLSHLQLSNRSLYQSSAEVLTQTGSCRMLLSTRRCYCSWDEKRKQNFPSCSSSCWFFLFLGSWWQFFPYHCLLYPWSSGLGRCRIRAVCCTTLRTSHSYWISVNCFLESDTVVALGCMMFFVKTPLNIDYFPFFH